jgi:hypothetical protein
MVIKCFSINYHKRRKFRAPDTIHARDIEEAWGIAGAPLPALSEEAHYTLAPYSRLHPNGKRPQLSFPL